MTLHARDSSAPLPCTRSVLEVHLRVHIVSSRGVEKLMAQIDCCLLLDCLKVQTCACQGLETSATHVVCGCTYLYILAGGA